MIKFANKKDKKKNKWWYYDRGSKKSHERKKKATMTKEAFDTIKQYSFNEELEKIAISWAGLGAARGAAVGALTGGVAGAVSNKKDRLKGALIGAGIGATAGAGGGAMIGKQYGIKATKALRGELAEKMSIARSTMRADNRFIVGRHDHKMKVSVNTIKNDPIGRKVYGINPRLEKRVDTMYTPAVREGYASAGTKTILTSFAGPRSRLKGARKGSLHPQDYRQLKKDIKSTDVNMKLLSSNRDEAVDITVKYKGRPLAAFEKSKAFKGLSDTEKAQWNSGEAAKKLRGGF